MLMRFSHEKAGLVVLLLAALVTGCLHEDYDTHRVFRYNESANLSSLDPAFARTLEPMWVVDQLYDGLVELDDELRVQPLIARSFHSKEEGTKWIFVLRDDVRFSPHPDVPGLAEGRRVIADDVVFSLNRLRDPNVASSGRWILDALDTAASGGGLVARGLDTVEFKLRQPYPPFLGLLATPYANVVAPEAVAYFGDEFRRNPVGSGPFQLAWWLEDVACVLHRNPHYWERDSTGQSLPYLDAVHIEFVADMGAEYQGLLQGKYDFMSGLHAAYMEELLDETGQLRSEHAGNIRMESTPFLKTDYIGFFVEQNDDAWVPWQDQAVRQALSLAVDRAGIARTLRRGAVVPTGEFVPPVLVAESAPQPVAFDQNRARAMLDSIANVHPRPWPTLEISTTSDYTDLCAALQYQWEFVGVEVAIDVVAPATHRERVANGKAIAFRKSWLADYPDAENFLSLFLAKNHAPRGPNYTHYTAPDFEKRFADAMRQPSETLRMKEYAAMNHMISEALPLIPLFHDQVTHFIRHDVEGWEINSVNRLDLRRVRKIPKSKP